MERVTVLLADDHPVVRQGLRTFLDLQPDMSVVGEAATGADNQPAVKIQVERDRLRGDGLDSTIRVRLSSPAGETVLIPVLCTVAAETFSPLCARRSTSSSARNNL